MNKNPHKSIPLAFILWLLSVLGFLGTNALTTGFLKNALPFISALNPKYTTYVLIVFLLLGLISFSIGALELTTYFADKKQINNFFLRKIVYFLTLLFLPFIILIYWLIKFVKLLKHKQISLNIFNKQGLYRLVFGLFVVFILTPAWIFGYFSFGVISTRLALEVSGYAPVTELVAGTGSMYPTFPKGKEVAPIAQYNETVAAPSFISYPSGIVLFDKRYFSRDLKRGDIITFTNEKTLEITKKQYGVATGFMKRIIALPGDSLQLRGGIVYLNLKPLKEPYTAKPRSTFAEDFLSECKSITVPENSVFVMGDNRKASGDSREIGFVSFDSIDHVLPIENQKGVWDKNYRDTTNDFSDAAKIKLDKNAYLQLLNEKRAQSHVQLLKYEPKLEESANLRGEAIIKSDDFSFNAAKSGLTMLAAMQQAGYSNIVYGEAPTQGYFEAAELIDNQFQFPDTKQFLLNKDYQDFGVAEVEGYINGCPTQVIVQHFAGYVPPNYPQSLITSWENALEAVNAVAPSWSSLKDFPDIYNKNKADIDRINDIITQRTTMIQGIVTTMKKNQWLTDAQNEYTKTTDKILSEEEMTLAKKINQQQ